MESRPYLYGEKHGEHRGYYTSGQLRFQYYFENDLSQGTHMEWYEDGSTRSEMNYINGYERGK